LFERDKFWYAVMGWVADVSSVSSVSGVTEVAGSIHINSTALLLISFFPLSVYHILIFHIPYFIFHIFNNAARMNSIHSLRKMFDGTEWVSIERGIFERDNCLKAVIGCNVL
jgi:hypothetical protein